MGITNISATITSLEDKKRKATAKFLIDTGASYTVIPQKMAKKLNLKPTKTQEFTLADGTTVKRKISYAMVKINGQNAPSTVIIGEREDTAIIGVITLENMGLMIDPFKRILRPMKLMLA